jgi:hypothetical protein
LSILPPTKIKKNNLSSRLSSFPQFDKTRGFDKNVEGCRIAPPDSFFTLELSLAVARGQGPCPEKTSARMKTASRKSRERKPIKAFSSLRLTPCDLHLAVLKNPLPYNFLLRYSLAAKFPRRWQT